MEAHQTSPSQDLAKLASIGVVGKSFSVEAPARSVTTYVIRGAAYTGRPGISYRNYYQLVNQENKFALSVDSAGGVVQEPSRGDDSQQWSLINVGGDYYKIVNRKSGLALDVSKASKELSARVLSYAYVDGTNQQWKLQDKQDGHFAIIARHSSLFLTPNSTTTGAELVQQSGSGGQGQRWRLVSAKP